MQQIPITHFSFETEDNVVLQALLYAGPVQSKRLAVYVHGAGSSSILNNPLLSNLLATRLAQSGVDMMAFNNRGAGYISKLRKSGVESAAPAVQFGGMAYEKISDSIYDIAAALAWAESKGYDSFYLIGHSTGANKLCYYLSSEHVNARIKRVFLLAGGDDVGLQRGRLEDPDRIAAVVTQAIGEGRGSQLVSADLFPGEHPISFASLYELITEGSDYDMFPFGRYVQEPGNPKLFRQFRSIVCPVTAIYGSEDFGTVIPAEDVAGVLTKINPNTDCSVITGADHNFTGYEQALSDQIARSL
jgi:pimeloyl-ACP methyl ester carboxylesterase